MNLRFTALLISALLLLSCAQPAKEEGWWEMRGIVLSTKELAEVDWPAIAARSGINTIGTHITPSEVVAFLDTDKGRAFTEACRKNGITVEHQLHAMAELLPRDLFDEAPEMFRMDSSGVRTADFNCCVHSHKALEIIASNAAELAKVLKPGNHRYYFWLDDNAPVCCCHLCREYSPSEQALIVENCMLKAIRQVDPKARVAHLAYSHFMEPPVKVQPEDGIFLEFAPIYRSWDVPLTMADVVCPRGYPVTNGDNLRWLEANLQVFDAKDAVVLEYWLDASLFSRWKRPAVELPWHPEVCQSDLNTYAGYGIHNVTSFAVYMDAEYFERFPSLKPIEEYGSLLNSYIPSESPRIVNIINFIRLTEPRSEEITDQVLFETVRSQAEDLRSKGLIGTYLLQYDALKDPSYQELMKEEMQRGCEVGAWWEITQPHVEDAGYVWRGRYPWDWHANVGFSVGYSQAEREHLVDVYMAKFKEIFGQYPKSVGSWFIEAGTMAYLRDRYGIEASCNCRDQVGTDGYTLWGGYWNGAYYPSRQNAYMPAQTMEGAIDIPVFRMLGSDPIYQYEAGVGGAVQSVVTLEPVYELGGGSPEWVDWFFRMFTAEPHLGYNYVQVGQENSFTWDWMKDGFVYQTSCLQKLQQDGTVRIETLAETGRWFKERYPVTPPSTVVATEDNQGNARKTLWFNSRNYRANLLWEGSALKFRDLHVFDERLRSEYLDKPDTLPDFHYETLPLVDGCLWSRADQMAGLHLVATAFQGGEPGFFPENKGMSQTVIWPSADAKGRFVLTFTENDIVIKADGQVGEWYLELSTVPGVWLPFTQLSEKAIRASYLGMDYGMNLEIGKVEDLHSEGSETIFRLVPQNNVIHITPVRY